MTLTHENLHAVATSGKGFNKAQLQLLLGTSFPKRGWLKRLIGTDITDELYAEVLALKGKKGKVHEPETYALIPPIKPPPQSPFMAMQIPLPLVPLVTKLLDTFKACERN